MKYKVLHLFSTEIEDFIEQNMEKKGYCIFINKVVELVVTAGLKPNNEYQIGVTNVDVSHNTLIVDVNIIPPKPFSTRKPNPSYPTVVAKLDISPEDFRKLSGVVVRNVETMEKFDRIQ